MRIIRKYWALLLLPFFLNCATHAPMSEMLMFSPKKVEPYYPDTTDYIYYSRYSIGFSVEQDLKNYDALRKYTAKHYQNGNISTDSHIPSVGLNSIFMFSGNDYFALNLVTGITTFGADMTLRLAESDYLTVGHTLMGGSQILFQKRMSYTYKTGSAVGVYYELYPEVMDYECYICLGPPEDSIIFLNAFGIRGLWMSHSGLKNKFFFKSTAKIGYIIDYGSPYISIGLSVGAF